MIMACLPKAGEKPVCYTFSGEKRDTLDALLAARIADVCGLEHQILRIGPGFFLRLRVTRRSDSLRN